MPDQENPDGLVSRRCFGVMREGPIWWVYETTNGGRPISTHTTRDGATTSCNQLNRAEGWDV